MTNETLAHLANLTLYSAMAVFTLAMIGYALYLAGLVPSREDAAAGNLRERQLVSAAAGTGSAAATGTPITDSDTGSGRGGDAPQLDTSLRARKAAGIARSLTWLGGLFLLASVVLRGASVDRAPLGNMFEFAVAGSTFVIFAFLIWSLRRDLRWLGLFIVGPVLLALGLGVTVWYTEAAELLPSLKSYWLLIHVTVATLSVALFTIGCALGVLYLVQDRVESEHRRSFMNRLPEGKALERMAYGVHIVAFPMWSFTLIAGAIWARQAWGSYWNWDPKEVWTFVIWVVYAAYLHGRATSGWSRQRAALIAIAGFGCILVNYGIVNVFFVSQHSYSGL